MKSYDLIIIGGGMVGLALAASLRNSTLQIAIIEGFPSQTPPEQITQRVSALNLASQTLLTKLGVWQELIKLRATPYAEIQVWEKDSFAKIEFNSKSLGLPHLGYIIENHLIQRALWQEVQKQKNAEILTALPQRIDIGESNAIVSLDDNQFISAKLVVGADGANSWVRKQTDIPLIFHDYGQHALVCNVETIEPHRNIARQIFTADSILAFLPLHQTNLCSIVWSLPPEQAQSLLQCDETEFNKTLTAAFAHQLGSCKAVSVRKTLPLTARYARNFGQPRIALIGDAAHTIHPMAGLGVNLGFQDAVCLAQEIEKKQNAFLDIGQYHSLRSYERHRKTEAIKMLAAMQGLKDLFSGDNSLKKLIRGIGLNAIDQMGIVKDQFIKQALGL
ncbi:MAG TPA: FAD-dependent 2-octaprenylphenol hydroxylase [Pasteurellaceae bacterium]|nr:FAD-dependent 2-octaprenylphenol hydroxylase [Pasteurellaceae bacterium]